MYASAVVWTFKPGSEDEVRKINTDTLIPAVKSQAGFRAYYAIHTAADTFLTVSLYDTAEHAEAANGVLAPLVRQHQGHLMTGMQRYAGEVAAEATAPA
jgi:heme-degrading monooxygenase HmoA